MATPVWELRQAAVQSMKYPCKLESEACFVICCCHRIASSILKEYNFTLDEDDTKVMNEAQLSKRQHFALHVRYGQRKILNRLITACVDNKE